MKKFKFKSKVKGWKVVIPSIAFLLVLIAGWFNHLFYCFEADAWGFLLAGIFFFPIGVIHGIWLWF